MPLIASLNKFARLLPPGRNKAAVGRLITDHLIPASNATVTEVPMRAGHRMLLDPRSRTEGGPFWNGEFDEDDIAFFRASIQPGDTVFDVGANVGLISIPIGCHLASLGSGQLISFEPVKTNYERLTANIKLNGLEKIARAYNIALGDHEGTLEISLETQHGAQTGNAIASSIVGDEKGFTRVSCTLTRLDTFAEQQGIPKVDFMKVDIEGAEVLFLNGAAGFITAHRPTIYGEFNSGIMPKFGHSFLDVYGFFKERNYRAFGFADTLLPHELTDPSPSTGNAFFVAEEKAESLLQRVTAARAKR
jgi:FkbM family methyltransferase